MSLREEFVQLPMQPGSNRRALCRCFAISPKTAYKWLARHALEGVSGLAERSRRPKHSPARTGVSYRGHAFRVCKALRGLPIAPRPVPEADAQREVLFCHQCYPCPCTPVTYVPSPLQRPHEGSRIQNFLCNYFGLDAASRLSYVLLIRV
ncbi:MAG: helix-turn-helix domain-containing protein [Deltaproteobacteria bacterium]|nr:helix-turn-helix domain-containing protein [Deltaproteobacteria bacterium]